MCLVLLLGNLLCRACRAGILDSLNIMLLQKRSTLQKSLRMGIDFFNVLCRSALHAKQCLLHLDHMLCHDRNIMLHQQVINIGNTSGRSIFNRHNAVFCLTVCYGFDHIPKGCLIKCSDLIAKIL